MKKPLKPAEIRAKKRQQELMEIVGEDQYFSDKEAESLQLTADLDWNQQLLEKFLDKADDIVKRRVVLPLADKREALILYVDGLADEVTVSQIIMRTLLIELEKVNQDRMQLQLDIIEQFSEKLVLIGEVTKENMLDKLLTSLLSGDTLLLIDKCDEAIVMDTRGWQTRGIQEPSAEAVIRGPREGFVETLRINTMLIRRKLRTSDLKIKTQQLGTKTKTDVAIIYIEGIANPKIVEEVEKRLKRINIDSVLESGYLEELIEDCSYSPFPQIQSTERPDKVVANLLEGRVAIVVDHTPFVMIVPTLFFQFLQAAEDYYERSLYVSLLRIIRVIALIISLALPGIYVAAITFHQEMIPFGFALSIASGREGTPFPGFLEAMFMGIVFEILREAGVRLPKPVGQAVSIVGALVIGESAVNAGVVSPIMVIVAALTAISSFAIPNFSIILSSTFIRFFLTLLAAVMGYFGLIWGLLVLLIHLASLRSFGVPYLSPIAPGNWANLKDTFVRVPWWGMMKRPHLLAKGNMDRIKPGLRPGPRQGRE
ncbi:MAG: spore germination protein [Bacillota bacterium]|nr:spore germination protein [Bacillota bacterium]